MVTKRAIYSNLAVHPGEALALELAERELTQHDLARMMGQPSQAISELVRGKKRLTAKTALQLERALEIPAHIWLSLQAEYDLVRAREESASEDNEP